MRPLRIVSPPPRPGGAGGSSAGSGLKPKKLSVFGQIHQTTRNSAVDEVGECYSLNYATVVKVYHPTLYFPVAFVYFVSESRLFDYCSS